MPLHDEIQSTLKARSNLTPLALTNGQARVLGEPDTDKLVSGLVEMIGALSWAVLRLASEVDKLGPPASSGDGNG